MDIVQKNFIKCGSPLGEWELHCSESQMQQVINDQEMLNLVLGAKFRKEKDVERLKKSILDDKHELIKTKSIIEELIKNGIPHMSYSSECCDGTNKDLKEAIKVAFKK